MRAAHGGQGFIEIASEITSVPYSLDVTAFEGIAGGMVIRRNINPRGFPDDPMAGEADTAGADGELIW